MDIKEFIKDSLLQIVDGIIESNEALKVKGASIPTKNVVGEGGYWYAKPINNGGDLVNYLQVDRLCHKSYLVNMTGTSYRIKEKNISVISNV